MKKTAKITLMIIVMIWIGTPVKAQSLSIDSPDYRTAIGLRGGELGGITFKRFIRPDGALEGILSLGYRDPRVLAITILYERHTSAFDVRGLRWYYGGGGHLTITGDRSGYSRRPWGFSRYEYESNTLGIGIDGIVGLEYKIPPIPFAISFDLKPYIEVTTAGGALWSLDPALGIKLTF